MEIICFVTRTLCALLFVTTMGYQLNAQIRMAPVILFDGQSTDGWSKADGKSHSGWVVQDGALHRAKGGGDLFHEGTWRDFELHFQFKISKGGNSGVKYRVKKYGNAWLGCEYQILDDLNTKERNKSAFLYDVYDRPNPIRPVVKPDEWNFCKIVVCGNRIEHWLNGVKVVNAVVGSDDWNQKVSESKFKDRDGFGGNREGRIFLQDHGNPVWFRHIIMIPLNCDGPQASNRVMKESIAFNSHSPDDFQETTSYQASKICRACDCCNKQMRRQLGRRIPIRARLVPAIRCR